jgi:hypothetical protein
VKYDVSQCSAFQSFKNGAVSFSSIAAVNFAAVILAYAML